MRKRPLITDHAVVRFLERHDGLDLGAVRLACGGALAADMVILDHLAAHAGLDVGAVRRRILTPTVRTALAMGAAGVRMGHVRLVITDGRVVTVRLTAWDRVPPHDKPWGRPRLRREQSAQQGGAW